MRPDIQERGRGLSPSVVDDEREAGGGYLRCHGPAYVASAYKANSHRMLLGRPFAVRRRLRSMKDVLP